MALRKWLPFALMGVGLALRLVHVNADLWEVHSWRQADVAMIAANFARGGFDWLRPQIDWAGAGPGYVGTEFPLVPLITSLLYTVLGEHIWLGRLVSIAFAVPTLVLFWLLVRDIFGERPALFALFFMAISPFGVYYSRTLQPESAMLFFSVGAIYFFKRWTENPSSLLYLSTLLCTALAVLVKLPAAIIGLPMAYAAHRAFGWRFLRRPEVWLLAVLSFVPAVLWYRHAFALALSNYPFHMFGEGLWVWDDPTHLLRWEGYARGGAKAALFLVTPVGFLFALAGLREQIGERAGIFAWWAIALLVYVIAGLEGIRNHEYYLLPLLPVVAAYAGVGADQLVVSSRRLVGAVALVAVPSLLLLATRYESASDRMLYEAGRTARSALPDDALVAAWDWGSPVLLYASGLHGWHFPHHARVEMGLFRDEDVPREEWLPVLDELRELGATHLVAPKPLEIERIGLLARPTSVQGMDSVFSADLDRRFFVSYEDERAVIYNLQRSRTEPGN